MFKLISFDDILIAMLLAAVLTWIINRFIDFIRFLSFDPLTVDYQPADIEKIVERCYILFPKEFFQFQGEVYRRGMTLRIITTQNKVFEGKFLGLNNDNMICIMTRKFIIAHAIRNIEEIEELD